MIDVEGCLLHELRQHAVLAQVDRPGADVPVEGDRDGTIDRLTLASLALVAIVPGTSRCIGEKTLPSPQ